MVSWAGVLLVMCFLVQLNPHLLGHAGQALFVLATVDSTVGQESVEQVFFSSFETGRDSVHPGTWYTSRLPG